MFASTGRAACCMFVTMMKLCSYQWMQALWLVKVKGPFFLQPSESNDRLDQDVPPTCWANEDTVQWLRVQQQWHICPCRWETGKSVDEAGFLWGALLSWKWLQTMESDLVTTKNNTLHCKSLNILKFNWFIYVCCFCWLWFFSFFQGVASPLPVAIP